MKQMIALAAALALSSSAFADYSDAVRIQKFCGDVGRFGGIVYQNRTAEALSKSEMSARIDKWEMGQRDKMAHYKALDYAFDKATSAKDAYMGSWAACMDLAN